MRTCKLFIRSSSRVYNQAIEAKLISNGMWKQNSYLKFTTQYNIFPKIKNVKIIVSKRSLSQF